MQFLEALHSLLLDVHPTLLLPYSRDLTPGRHLQLVTGRMKRALRDHRILRYPPSLLAMETLRLEVELACPQFAPEIMESMSRALEVR